MIKILRKLKPPQIVVISFLCAIFVGTILLSMPLASRAGERMPVIDSLFTAASATCVTGLVVRDTGAYFSEFGKLTILVLLQIGGLGIMTFSTLFAVLLGKKLTIKEDLVIQRTMVTSKVQNLATLIKYIIFITLGIEFFGAACLALRWTQIVDWPFSKIIMSSIFHSVSAFCNAGFSLFPGSFSVFSGDIYINLTMIALIVLGSIGFVVIMELPRFAKKRNLRHISLQSKVVLTVSLSLILIGALLFFLVEQNNTMAGLSLKEKVLGSLFQSTTARTAGFNTLSIGRLAPPTLCLLMFLMFIGASPGSTGGGIKTCTFGVILATLFSMLKNRDRVSMFKRTIPKEVVRKSLVVLLLALVWIFAATFLISIVEYKRMAQIDNFFLRMLFEITSAFGTVGLSTGITSALGTMGKLILIFTMFVGRVGPLTLALAIALQHDKISYVYPEEKMMIG
ncbi:MAG: TrkH family potassium uptake protein [Candidatus Omnitrophota bacterium]